MKSMQYYTSFMRAIDNEGWGRGNLIIGCIYYSHAAKKNYILLVSYGQKVLERGLVCLRNWKKRLCGSDKSINGSFL